MRIANLGVTIVIIMRDFLIQDNSGAARHFLFSTRCPVLYCSLLRLGAPYRCPLLEKGAHALTLVIGSKGKIVQATLKLVVPT